MGRRSRWAAIASAILSVTLCWASGAAAQPRDPEQETPQPDEGAGPEASAGPLRVAVAGSAPFVMREDGELTGISIAVWQDVARRLALEYELVEVDNAAAAIDAVAAGEVDVAIGPLSITSARAQRVAFTQPYYEGALSIAAPAEGAGFGERLAPFLTKAFLGGFGVLLVVLTGVGLLFWLVERRKNDTIPKRPLAGIGTGMWLALVTMTTVGYGDRVPITPGGRVVASVWMLVSMIVVSSLTAFLATAFTLSQIDRGLIERAEDLDTQRVAVVEGTTGAPFARRHGAQLVRAPSVEEALQAVAEGRADAMVYDRPILQYHLRRNEELPIAISESLYEPLGYGFAAPQRDPLRARMDVVLLELSESGRLDEIVGSWL